MRRYAALFSILLLIPASAAGQSSPKDSQALQDLLAEVRQLRRDIQTTTIAVQRAQILLYRVRSEQDAVAQAIQRLDRVRSELASTRRQQKELAVFVKRTEDSAQETAVNPNGRKEMEDQIPLIKTRPDALATEEQEKVAEEADAEQRLRDEQAKLADLQAQLDRLDAELGNAGRPSANLSQ